MPDRVIDLEKRLARSNNDQERLKLMLELVEANEYIDYVEVWKYGSEALELAFSLNDRKSIALAQESIATSLWKLAEYAESLDYYEKALDNFLSQGNLHGVARCYCGMGIITGSMENYRVALDHFDEGLSAARRAGKDQLAATLTGNIGHIYFKLGNYVDAMKCFERGLDFYRDVENLHGSANMLAGMAGINVYQGEYDKGLELVRRALQLHTQAKHGRGITVSMMNVGITLQKMGKLDEAKREFKKALNHARSIRLKSSEHEILKNLSEVCAELEEHEESAKYLEMYLASEQEAKKMAVQRKTEQFRQQQQIRSLQGNA